MGMSLTVIIPTLNESESIGPTIDQIPRDVPWLDVKVLVIDGNSTDNTAEEAEKIGFVNKVFDDETFMEDVNNYAQTLAHEVSPRSIKIMKKQMWQGLLQGLDNAVEIADNEMLQSFSSDDFKEGVAHFIEKRAPKFSGK